MEFLATTGSGRTALFHLISAYIVRVSELAHDAVATPVRKPEGLALIVGVETVQPGGAALAGPTARLVSNIANTPPIVSDFLFSWRNPVVSS